MARCGELSPGPRAGGRGGAGRVALACSRTRPVPTAQRCAQRQEFSSGCVWGVYGEGGVGAVRVLHPSPCTRGRAAGRAGKRVQERGSSGLGATLLHPARPPCSGARFSRGSLCGPAGDGPWPRVPPLRSQEPCPGQQASWAELLRGAVGQSLTRGLRSPEGNLQEKALPSRNFLSFFFSFFLFFSPSIFASLHRGGGNPGFRNVLLGFAFELAAPRRA